MMLATRDINVVPHSHPTPPPLPFFYFWGGGNYDQMNEFLQCLLINQLDIIYQLTVAGRPTLPKASSISMGVHMCWSDFRNILRFPLNAELTYIQTTEAC